MIWIIIFLLGFVILTSYIGHRDGGQSQLWKREADRRRPPIALASLGQPWREEAGAALRLPAIGVVQIFSAGKGPAMEWLT